MTVHVVLNSHLDPVWLWNVEQGIDAAIATARTACDILDDYPETHITRGEAWFYEMVEQMDPQLFERIRRFVQQGRWHVVGGFYVQPDCNLPSAETFLQHGRISQRYFREKFGVEAHTGFHVDSFGHNASMPDFLTAAGMTNYVMMRPSVQEMRNAPPSLFDWKTPKGNCVRTFRISNAYCCGTYEMLKTNIDKSIEDAPQGAEHCMAFVGVGDHGGGPIPCEIEWIREHRNYRPGVELVFSHPDAYFEAVKDFPCVTYCGELQHHAIGCYTAVSQVKRDFAAAENLLAQAAPFAEKGELDNAWKKVLFASFHDVLAGSSIKSAYELDVNGSLGGVRETARNIIVRAIRRRNVDELHQDEAQRLVFDNTGDVDYDGMLECEPWYSPHLIAEEKNDLFLEDVETGEAVPFKEIEPESICPVFRIVLPLKVKAGGRRVLRMRYGAGRNAAACKAMKAVDFSENAVAAGGLRAMGGLGGLESLVWEGRELLAAPVSAKVFRDDSDTWSHGLAGFSGEETAEFQGGGWHVFEQGPLRASCEAFMEISHASLRYEIAMDAAHEMATLRLLMNWTRKRELVKLCLKPAFKVVRMLDWIPGGTLERKADAEEYPFHRAMVLEGENESLAVVSKDIFGMDAQPDGTVRLTLLRSPYYAHHDPQPVPDLTHGRLTEQGEHLYEIQLLPMRKTDTALVEKAVAAQKSPIFFSEFTRGMKPVYHEKEN